MSCSPSAQPGKLLLSGTAQGTPARLPWAAPVPLQTSVLSLHWNTASSHGLLSPSQCSLFLSLSTGKLVFPFHLKLPSSGYSATQLLVIFTYQPYSDQTTTPSPIFLLSKQINLSTNSFCKSPSYSVWPLFLFSVICSWILSLSQHILAIPPWTCQATGEPPGAPAQLNPVWCSCFATHQLCFFIAPSNISFILALIFTLLLPSTLFSTDKPSSAVFQGSAFSCALKC